MRRARAADGACYSLVLRRRSPGERPLSCIVSKRVAPRAVDRNRAKRVCRAVFAPYLKKRQAALLLVYVRKPALAATHAALLNEAAQFMRKVITKYD